MARNRKRKAQLKVSESVKIKAEASSKTTVGAEMLVKNEQSNKKFFVKESLINELKKGSFENYIARVVELANANLKDIVGEASRILFPLGTFKNHALFSDEMSNVYRLFFKTTADGLAYERFEKVEEIKKYEELDLGSKIEDTLTLSLVQSIAKSDEGCENKLKEDFKKMLEYKKSGSAEGFILIGCEVK